MLEPAASSTAVRFLMHWCCKMLAQALTFGCGHGGSRESTVWAWISPGIISMVVGSIATEPEQYTMPLATMACEYMPGSGLGAPDVRTGVLDILRAMYCD